MVAWPMPPSLPCSSAPPRRNQAPSRNPNPPTTRRTVHAVRRPGTPISLLSPTWRRHRSRPLASTPHPTSPLLPLQLLDTDRTAQHRSFQRDSACRPCPPHHGHPARATPVPPSPSSAPLPLPAPIKAAFGRVRAPPPPHLSPSPRNQPKETPGAPFRAARPPSRAAATAHLRRRHRRPAAAPTTAVDHRPHRRRSPPAGSSPDHLPSASVSLSVGS